MTLPTIEELRRTILEIEQTLDDGTYRPGPWARMLKRAHLLEPQARAALSEDVSRVGDKLHRFNRPGRVASVTTGVLGGLLVFAAGIAGVVVGVRLDNAASTPVILAGTFATCAAAQPLFKVFVGSLLGVRYSYVWVWMKIEPRVKMRYGTYLSLPLARRLILQAAGTVGSASVFLVTGYALAAQGDLPGTATACIAIGLFFVGLNTALFVLGFAGHRGARTMMSGGLAAAEILEHRRLARTRAELERGHGAA